MKSCGARPALVACAGLFLASSAALADEERSCDRALQIDGPAEPVSALRAALHEGSLRAPADATCRGAVVSLRERVGGYSIALVVAGSHVERDVATIGAAATWVEGWLGGSPADSVDAPSPPEGAVPHAAAAPRNTGAPRDRADRVEVPRPRVIYVDRAAQVDLIGTGSTGSDGSVWGGVELSGRLQLTSTLWAGAALGVDGDSTWFGPAGDADDSDRFALRASVRAGGRFELAPGVDEVLGGGAGVTWGKAIRSFPGADDEEIEQGGFFLEAHADTSFRVSRRLSVLAGIGARGRFLSGRGAGDDLEPLVPDAMAAVTGELRLGAGWNFGGAP